MIYLSKGGESVRRDFPQSLRNDIFRDPFPSGRPHAGGRKWDRFILRCGDGSVRDHLLHFVQAISRRPTVQLDRREPLLSLITLYCLGGKAEQVGGFLSRDECQLFKYFFHQEIIGWTRLERRGQINVSR